MNLFRFPDVDLHLLTVKLYRKCKIYRLAKDITKYNISPFPCGAAAQRGPWPPHF